MSRDAMNKPLEDITRDSSEWQRDKQAMIGRYEVTADERDALAAGDEAKLMAMGVEERLVKFYNAHP